MRIVHYQPQLRGRESGTANAGRGWCEALARQGVDVVGLVDRADITRPAPFGTQTRALEHWLTGPLRVPNGILPGIAGADAVVLHGGWLLGNVVAGRVCMRANIPFVVTTHGVYMHEVMRRRPLVKRVWAAAFERRHLRRAVAVHVSFPEERVSMEQGMRIRVPTIVAPNGIAIPENTRWDGGSGGYLLWLGRFDIATKGLDILLRALQRMPPSERPHVRLHGPDWRNQKERLRTLAEELHLDPWVTVGEPIYGDAKWELIAKAAGCVYPSRWDACPVAVSEAAAIGVPTLVTRYPLANRLASKDAAIQVDVDAASIARGISRLLTGDASDVGRRAAEVARRELSWDSVASSWLHQLRDLLRSGQGMVG